MAVPSPAGLRPLLALGVDGGLFLVVAAAPGIGAIRRFARYADTPLPRLVDDAATLAARPVQGGLTVYTAHLRWPGLPAGAVQVGCVTASGRKPLLTLDCIPVPAAGPQPTLQALQALIAPYRSALRPVIEVALPPGHALCRALQAGAAASPPPAVAGPLGQLDGLVDGLVQGWAWNPAAPDTSCTVELLHQGAVVGRGRADRYRADLQASGIGDGCHQFRLTPSFALFDGRPHELSARVVETGAMLPGGPVRLVFPAVRHVQVDWIPRAEALRLLEPLAQRAQVHNARALAVLRRLFSEACLQLETGQQDQARAGFQRLATILGPNALCHCKIAETWLLQQQRQPALAAYGAALACAPDDAAVRRRLQTLTDREPNGAADPLSLV